MSSIKTRAKLKDVKELRQQHVWRLRLRGMSEREIHANLPLLTDKSGQPQPGAVQPNGTPWSLGTVHKDCVIMRERQAEEFRQDVSSHRSKCLAEIREARRIAWSKQDVRAVLIAIKAERELLGLDAPVKVASTTPEGASAPLVVAASGMTSEALEAIVAMREAAAQPAA